MKKTGKDVLREDWILAHKVDEKEFKELSKKEVAVRCIKAPLYLFDIYDVEFSNTNVHNLPHGGWYDICTETFYFFDLYDS
jgi:hypothetical protein